MNSSCGSGVSRAVADRGGVQVASRECRAASVTETGVTVAPSRATRWALGRGTRFPAKGIVVTASSEHSRISVFAERQGIGEHTRLRRRSPKWRLNRSAPRPDLSCECFHKLGICQGFDSGNQPEVSELTALYLEEDSWNTFHVTAGIPTADPRGGLRHTPPNGKHRGRWQRVEPVWHTGTQRWLAYHVGKLARAWLSYGLQASPRLRYPPNARSIRTENTIFGC